MTGVWLRPDAVAADLGVSRSTVLRLARAGDLPARKFGKQWRINRSALETYDEMSDANV